MVGGGFKGCILNFQKSIGDHKKKNGRFGVDELTMSVPMVSEERVRGPRSPENLVSPVVAGNDSYTAMI